jgi:hypothetical protein
MQLRIGAHMQNREAAMHEANPHHSPSLDLVEPRPAIIIFSRRKPVLSIQNATHLSALSFAAAAQEITPDMTGFEIAGAVFNGIQGLELCIRYTPTAIRLTCIYLSLTINSKALPSYHKRVSRLCQRLFYTQKLAATD